MNNMWVSEEKLKTAIARVLWHAQIRYSSQII